MKAGLVIEGIGKMIKLLKGIEDEVDKELLKAGKMIGMDAQAELKKELSFPGTGIPYRRRSVIHIASEPGRPPAPDTGRLRASARGEAGRNLKRQAVVDIKVGGEVAFYGPLLEEGTKNIEPRPFFQTVIDRRTPVWILIWRAAVARGLKRTKVG